MRSLLIGGSFWGAMWPHLRASVVSRLVSAGRITMADPEKTKYEWVKTKFCVIVTEKKHVKAHRSKEILSRGVLIMYGKSIQNPIEIYSHLIVVV